jgi:PPOX class probable F420-dependent enzyme
MSEIIPASHLDILNSTALAHIATIGPSGEPQASPVWFDWDGTFIRFAQVARFRQKVRNLEREPRVAISMTDPNDDYRYLEIRGVVERIEYEADTTFINSMSKKYLDKDVYPFTKPGDTWQIVVIRPVRCTKMG